MYRILTITLSSLFLFACGGDDSSSDETTTPVAAFNLTSATDGSAGKITFEWDGDNTGLTYTVCEKDVTADNNCSALESVTSVNSVDVHIDSLLGRISSEFFILASNGSSTASTNELTLSSDNITHLIRYLKASNTDKSDGFGNIVSLSKDGKTLAVTASSEDSAATGVNVDLQEDDSVSGSGAVYVFRFDGEDWAQQAYIKASNAEKSDVFGGSMSLSEDGNKLAVGAYAEDSNATGINGDQTDNSMTSSGAVYIFEFDGIDWVQQAYIKASNTEGGDKFGFSLSLSGDGSTLVVGAKYEDSIATGINGDESNNDGKYNGAAYLFRYADSQWTQQAYIKASETDESDYFSDVLSLSSDGNTLAVGARYEDSSATGVNGDESNDSESASGAVYLFRYDNSEWSQEAYLKSSTAEAGDYFGNSVTLSSDASTLAIGAYSEDSSAMGINGDESDNDASASGAVYVFRFSDNGWTQQAYIKASNTGVDDNFGRSTALSSNGNVLVVGANGEASYLATGINGDESDNSLSNSGAVYKYIYDGIQWTQKAYIKTSDSTHADPDDSYSSGDGFGNSVSLSGDGETLVVGAKGEDSGATGVDGNQQDETATSSGAVYVY